MTTIDLIANAFSKRLTIVLRPGPLESLHVYVERPSDKLFRDAYVSPHAVENFDHAVNNVLANLIKEVCEI